MEWIILNTITAIQVAIGIIVITAVIVYITIN